MRPSTPRSPAGRTFRVARPTVSDLLPYLALPPLTAAALIFGDDTFVEGVAAAAVLLVVAERITTFRHQLEAWYLMATMLHEDPVTTRGLYVSVDDRQADS